VSAGNFKNIRYCFKSFIYLIVLYSYSFSHAGSYDDYFIAIKRDEAAAVSALLKRGFDANTLNPAGEHGLLLAIREPSLKVAAVLIDWPQTNVEVRSKQDESPLMLASLQGLTEICQLLIAKGADVNKPGWAPLHYAATHGHLAVMTLLLDNDAYIDAASPNGTTPLMMAAHYGTPAAVTLLLEAGADPMLKNDQGLSAIDFAHRANRPDVTEIIAAFIRGLQPKGIW
jgi:ankyrin repeat protein